MQILFNKVFTKKIKVQHIPGASVVMNQPANGRDIAIARDMNNPWFWKKIPHTMEELSLCVTLLSLCSRSGISQILEPSCPRACAP